MSIATSLTRNYLGVLLPQSGPGITTIDEYDQLYILDPGVQNLIVSGADGIGVGNNLDNLLIAAGTQNFTLVAGTGNDVMIGNGSGVTGDTGAGNTTFVIAKGDGNDVISNFRSGTDIVQLQNFTNLTSLVSVKAAMTQSGADVVLNLGPNQSLTFRNETIAGFQQQDFALPAFLPGMTLRFDDEFNNFVSSPLGTQGWMTQGGNVWRTLPSNNEAEYYSDSSVGVNPFTDSNGVLTITAAPGSNPLGLPYNSGIISTEHSLNFEYGLIEVSAKLPAGAGLWPAIWLLPSSGGWPPELDIMEMLGNDTNLMVSTSHSGPSNNSSSTPVYVSDSTQNFHTYGLDWEPNTITWYFDGNPIKVEATPYDMHQPMYLLINLAVGGPGSWPGPPTSASEFPAQMQIDYARYYASSATTAVTGTAIQSATSSVTITGDTASADLGPTISGIATSPGSGVVAIGGTATLTLTFSSAVTVTGGTPTLALNDGGTASYVSGSGSTKLVFSYTVAGGQTTPDLALVANSAVALNGATIRDSAGHDAVLASANGINPAGTLQINGGETTLLNYITPGSGTFLDAAGNSYTLDALENSFENGQAIPGGDNTGAMQYANGLVYGEYLDTGAWYTWNQSSWTATSPPPAPTSVVGSGVTAVTTSPGSGQVTTGATVTLALTFNAAVTVAGGTPKLTLNDGGTATYTSGSGSNTLLFSYTVVAGQTTADLALAASNAIVLNGATIRDAAGFNAVLSTANGFTPSGALQVNGGVASAIVTSVATSPGSGALTTGASVALTVTFSTAVTVAGGAPSLALNDGGVATYVSGSGSNALVFTHTIVSGQSSADLALAPSNAIVLNGATIRDGSGNNAVLTGANGFNPAGTLQINGSGTPASNYITPGVGSFSDAAGNIYSIDAAGNAIENGQPIPNGNNTGAMEYANSTIYGEDGNSGTWYSWNQSGWVGPVSAPPPPTIVTGTSITSVATTPATGVVMTGGTVTLTVNFSVAVIVAGGTPTLVLNDGGTATYVSGSGSNALVFTYTVAAGQMATDLALAANNAVVLNGASIRDGSGNSAVLTGANGYNPSGTLQINPPGGGTAPNYATPGVGSFADTAGNVYSIDAAGNAIENGQPIPNGNNTGAMEYFNGAVYGEDGNSGTWYNWNQSTWVGPVGAPPPPTTGGSTSLTTIAMSPGSGALASGGKVTLTVTFSAPVTVAGGPPTLALNDGGTATYVSGSGTSALTFSYTVASGQNTADLTLAATNAVVLNGATIRDAASNNAVLTAANGYNPVGTMQIDTTAPAISAITTSPGSGDLAAGATATLTVVFSEAVTVAGGPPTLALNDGGTATYVSGSGSTSLVFSYTVAAGQNTADLALAATNAVVLNGATIRDAAANNAVLTAANGYVPAGTLQIDTTAPTISTITTSPGVGVLATGATDTLTVTFSEAVTVSGGPPALALNDGGTATYVSGSGTNSLVFKYTAVAGQNTPDLAMAASNAVVLNGATIRDAAGNNAVLTAANGFNPAGTLQVDTTAPSISAITTSPGSGDLAAGASATLTVTFSDVVNVAGGPPTLALNDGGTATYMSGSGSNALVFSYTVAAGQNTADLALAATNAVVLNGATIRDAAANNAVLTAANGYSPAGTLQIDTTAPTISAITTSPGSGVLATGATATLTAAFSEAVTVSGGTPTLVLNDGGTATYVSGTGSSSLVFSYTVAAGQNTADLALGASNAFTLNGGAVRDAAGNNAVLTGANGYNPAGTLQINTSVTGPAITAITTSPGAGSVATGSTVTLTVAFSAPVTVAGGTPTLALNDGGTATYVSGSGTGALVFSYAVAAGQSTADLALAASNAVVLNGATIRDTGGNSAVLTAANGYNPAGTLQVNATLPTVSSIITTPGSGILKVGSSATFTVAFNEAVTVAGGTPTLALNDGGKATYTSGSGLSQLVFSYTVAAGQNVSDLTLAASNAFVLNGASILDAAGNSAVLTAANGYNPAGTLQVDTTAPSIVSLSTSPGSGQVVTGSTITLTVAFTEAVTVASGTPTLALNDGGTATYKSGSGTNALLFTYTVGAGQTTPDLALIAANAFVLNGATIRDAAGNNAVLTGANGNNPAGTLQINPGGGTSPGVSYITPGNGSFIDAAGNVYNITSTGNAFENGKFIPNGDSTGAMEYANGTVYGEYLNTGSWYIWNQHTWVWTPIAPPAPTTQVANSVNNQPVTSGTPLVVTGTGNTYSPGNGTFLVTGTANGAQITLGDGNQSVTVTGTTNTLTTGNGNEIINLTGSGNIVTTGVGASSVTLSGDNEKIIVGATPAGTTTIAAKGTAEQITSTGKGNVTITGPTSNSTINLSDGDQTVTLAGLGNMVTVGTGTSTITLGAGQGTVHAAGGSITIFAGVSNDLLDAGPGINFIHGGSSGDTYVLNATGQGLTTIYGFGVANGDKLDLSRTLASVASNVDLTNVGNYITASVSGGNTTLFVDPSGTNVSPYAFASLQGVSATVAQLLSNHDLMVP